MFEEFFIFQDEKENLTCISNDKFHNNNNNNNNNDNNNNNYSNNKSRRHHYCDRHNLFGLVFDLFKVLASREVILQNPRPCELAHRLMLQRLDKKLKSAYETWLKNNKKNDIK